MSEETLKGGGQAAKPANQNNVDEQALADVEGEDRVAPENALVTQPSFLPARPGEQQFVGRISMPILQVTAGVGKLAQLGHAPGDIVLDNDTVLFVPPRPANKNVGTPPLRFIIVNWVQYYKEYRPPVGEKPRVFRTAAEALAAGLSVERDPVTGALPSAPPAMTWTMLIEKPAGMAASAHFLLKDPEDGKEYAPARMFIDKTAYLTTSSEFGKACNFICQDRGISSVVWEMITKTRKATTGNEPWVPYIRIVEHLADTKLQRLAALLQR